MVVRSEHSLLSLLVNVSTLAVVAFLAYAYFDLPGPRTLSWLEVAGAAVGLLMLWAGLTGLTTRVRVSLSGIDKRDLWGRRSVSWADVDRIALGTNYFGGYNLSIGIHGRRAMALPTSLLGNGAEIAKAVLEAATTTNPHVVLLGQAASAYGPPPYGVFPTDPAVAFETFRQGMLAVWREADEEARERQDREIARRRIHQQVRELDADLRSMAERVLAEWALADDPDLRSDALALIRDLDITRAVPAQYAPPDGSISNDDQGAQGEPKCFPSRSQRLDGAPAHNREPTS